MGRLSDIEYIVLEKMRSGDAFNEEQIWSALAHQPPLRLALHHGVRDAFQKFQTYGYFDVVGEYRSGNTQYKLNNLGNKSFDAERTIREKDDKLKEWQDKKIELDYKNAKRVYSTYWWTFWFAVIGLAISLVLLVLKLI